MKSILGQLLNGRYSIVRQLAAHHNYKSYQAEDRHHSRIVPCVIKQFSMSNNGAIDTCSIQSELKNSLFKRIEQVRDFNQYPQLTAITDYFLWGQDLFVVREYAPGTSLAKEIQERKFEEAELIEVIKGIIQSLLILHHKQQKHLNLKPENIILSYDDMGKLKVVLPDFDRLSQLIANSSEAHEVLTKEDQAAAYYLAPEQRLGQSELKSDFYSLGAIAIKALTGKFIHQISFQNLDNFARAFIVDDSTGETFSLSHNLAKLLHSLIQVDCSLRPNAGRAILTTLECEQNLFVLPTFESKSRVKNKAKKTNQASSKSKKKLLAVFLGTSFALTLFGLVSYLFMEFKQQKQLNFVEYRNPEKAIVMSYPEAWSIRELEDPITGEVLVLTAPLEDEADTFREQIYLSISNLEKNRDREEAIISKVIDSQEISNVYYQEESDIMSDRVAHSMVYQRQQDKLALQQKEIFTFVDNKAYLITYIAEKERYLNFLPIVNEVIDSFVIGD